MTLTFGTRLGHYQVLSPLGAGGMGEVYLAEDTRLKRKVALKLLPAHLTSDADRVRRFEQEAQAASALNHPNIITIYEIGQDNGTHYIATEFIDGDTLRQRLAGEKIKLSAALDVAVQVASALAAAHEAGIIHRDIKPENIMVRRDGIVKVLDFGLAKLTEGRPHTTDTDAPTAFKVKTDPGTVMGTAQYMSPEQARGHEVDARTDIFSLGVVLYEMIVGRAPFEGQSASDIIAAILTKEPPPLSRSAPEAPAELERIVTKALEKDREERYQTVKDMLLDLKRLKRRLEFEAEQARANQPAVSGSESGSQSSGISVESARQSAASSGEVAAVHTTSSAEYLISEIKRHKTGVIIALAALVVIVIGGLFGLYKLVSQKSSDQASTQTTKPAATAQNMKIQRLTANGKTESAAISPDGKYVAYVVKDGAQQSLWMRLVTTNSQSQVVPPADVSYGGQTFSPDGTYIYYVVTDKNNPNGALYQVPVLSGATRKVLVNVGSPITFSPDGNRFAFVRNDNAASGEDQLMIANVDGTGERKLAARKADTWFSHGGPAWSPDGKVIACGAGSYSGGFHMFVVAVEVETRGQKEFTAQRWADVGRVAWLADGSGLVVSAVDEGTPFSQIWQLSYPRGEARKVINDLNNYSGISLTAESKALVAVQGDSTSNIWIAPNGDVNRAKQITSGKLEGSASGLVWTPDGRIVYRSLASGNLDIWIMNQDGTDQKQLTTDPNTDEQPAVSPDGRYIVFVSHRAGFPSLWRMDIDGGNLKQLTERQEDYNPQISSDGRWIVFDSWRSGKDATWKMPIDGGAPVKLSDKFTRGPVISPDGKLIASFYKDEQPNSPWRIMVIPFEGGAAIKTFVLPPTVDDEALLRWTPDGRALTYIDTRGTPNLWSQPLDGGQPKQLTDFKVNGVWQRAWSSDGKWLALVRSTITKDVVLIRDFR